MHFQPKFNSWSALKPTRMLWLKPSVFQNLNWLNETMFNWVMRSKCSNFKSQIRIKQSLISFDIWNPSELNDHQKLRELLKRNSERLFENFWWWTESIQLLFHMLCLLWPKFNKKEERKRRFYKNNWNFNLKWIKRFWVSSLLINYWLKTDQWLKTQ